MLPPYHPGMDEEREPAIPSPGGRIVVAAADVGAHSTHLLVAATSGHRLEPLLDISDILALGAVVDREGFLPAAARAGLVATLGRYADAARELGALEIAFIGTEPMRIAADAARIVAEVEGATGVPLHVLGHEEEGRLSLLGVTAGAPLEVELLVADIGGGSTELVFAGPAGPVRTHGLSLGAARLTELLVSHDPPTPGELDTLRREADRVLAAAPDGAPRIGVLVGGTGSNLAKVAGPDAPRRALTGDVLAALVAAVCDAPAEEVAARLGIRSTRARVLPAGAAIVAALAARYRLPGLLVRDEGIREGAVLALARAGRGWRDRLDRLAHGWNQ